MELGVTQAYNTWKYVGNKILKYLITPEKYVNGKYEEEIYFELNLYRTKMYKKNYGYKITSEITSQQFYEGVSALLMV